MSACDVPVDTICPVTHCCSMCICHWVKSTRWNTPILLCTKGAAVVALLLFVVNFTGTAGLVGIEIGFTCGGNNGAKSWQELMNESKQLRIGAAPAFNTLSCLSWTSSWKLDRPCVHVPIPCCPCSWTSSLHSCLLNLLILWMPGHMASVECSCYPKICKWEDVTVTAWCDLSSAVHVCTLYDYDNCIGNMSEIYCTHIVHIIHISETYTVWPLFAMTYLSHGSIVANPWWESLIETAWLNTYILDTLMVCAGPVALVTQ